MASRPGIIRRTFGGLWWLLNATRQLVFNLLFLALLVVLAVVWFGGERKPVVKEKTALVLNLHGELVEEFSGRSRELLLAESLGERRRETRVRDVLDTLEAAGSDANIVRAVLVLDDLSGGGTAALREIASALARFRASGKEIVAWGSSFSQRQYFLAAHADEVYLHPFGDVALRGIGGSGLYFKEALDKLGVTIHGFQAGKYKSAIEPLTRQAPSPEALEADRAWMNDLWSTWTSEVETARKLAPGQLGQLIEELPQRLAAANGDPARLALDEKLVDGLKTRDEFRAEFIARGAAADDTNGTFRQIGFESYLSTVAPKTGPRIGVIVAQGEILDDQAPAGMVGGRTTAELVRRAREDKEVKALVLRIDSPGGSVFGSELIRRELELTRKAGKPVVASMGDVAASGGYWIALASDEILADPATITGSIGVLGMRPTFEKALEKLGIGTGGASTTWIAAAQDPGLPLDARVAQMAQARVDHYYQRFIGEAAMARGSTPERINEVAQGRVWTGRQAKANGLVDTLGGLQDAIASAARRARLESYRVDYIEREPRGLERWLSLLLGQVAQALQSRLGWTPAFALNALDAAGQDELHRLGQLFGPSRDDPLRAYAYCFCRPQ